MMTRDEVNEYNQCKPTDQVRRFEKGSEGMSVRRERERARKRESKKDRERRLHDKRWGE
jgi:hypothetical protein